MSRFALMVAGEAKPLSIARTAAGLRERCRARILRTFMLGLGIVVLGLSVVPSAGAFIYWTDRGAVGGTGTGTTVGRANLDGTGVNDSFITGASGPVGVAVNGSSIFWANTYDTSTSSIGRANLDGSRPVQEFVTEGSSSFPCGVAVSGNYIYWGRYQAGANSIARATLDGSQVTENFISTGSAEPCGVAVDGNYIYWANEFSGGSLGTTIGRDTIDGNPANVNESFISGASQPVGVAVSGGFLYWANEYGINAIGRANVSGGSPTGINQSFVATGTDPCGVAADGSYLYWANLDAGSIGRDTIDGNPANVNQSFITGLNHPCGVAVDSLPAAPTVSVTTPADGASYALGQTVDASYSCAEGAGGTGLTSSGGCVGTVANGAAIDTSTVGSHSFTVTATSQDGKVDSSTVDYTVLPIGGTPITLSRAFSFTLQGDSAGAVAATIAARDTGRFEAKATFTVKGSSKSFPFDTSSAHATVPGVVMLKLQPDARARAALNKYGQLQVSVAITSSPPAGAGMTRHGSIVLRKAKSGGAEHLAALPLLDVTGNTTFNIGVDPVTQYVEFSGTLDYTKVTDVFGRHVPAALARLARQKCLDLFDAGATLGAHPQGPHPAVTVVENGLATSPSDPVRLTVSAATQFGGQGRWSRLAFYGDVGKTVTATVGTMDGSENYVADGTVDVKYGSRSTSAYCQGVTATRVYDGPQANHGT